MFDYAWIFFIVVAILIVRSVFDLIELPVARQLYEQGQVADWIVRRKWKEKWEDVDKDGPATKYAWYAIFEYSMSGAEHELKRKITKKEYQELNEGGIIKVRYLPDKPDIFQI